MDITNHSDLLKISLIIFELENEMKFLKKFYAKISFFKFKNNL